MKLKKLAIIGFKSFAEKVVLNFNCPIIGIVGPNGCGKSNIVDAFRWVIGEQSAKSLRGDKMQDILFAGTDQRKSLNYAEVSVTLTEIEGDLPIPYEELTITRRLYRSGESEYLINKELVRLKDIQELFLGSGIGKNAFSIFEQGKLDQIMHLSPIERRTIFDEAAGTSLFLFRKKEAVRKLSSINENFTRVRDIHAEIEKQTKQLKKQASHAKGYQENARLLEEIERKIFLHRWQVISKAHSILSEQIHTLSQSVKEEIEKITILDAKLSRSKQELSTSELSAKQLQKELNLNETKVRVLESEINQHKQRILEIKKREENVKVQLNALKEEQNENGSEIIKKELQLQTLAHNENLKESIKKGREEHLKKVQEEGKLNTEIQKKIFNYEAKVARLEALKAFENSHNTSLEVSSNQIDLQKKKVTILSTDIDLFKEETDQLEKELQHLRKQQADIQKEEHKLLRQITEAEAQQKALNRLKDDMEGFSTGAKTLLKEAKNENSSLYNKVKPLFEYLIPYKGYEELLASSMKIYSETLVVADEDGFVELLSFAKKKKISDFSVVIVNSLKTQKIKDNKTSLAAYLEQNLVAYHFANNFKITEDNHFYDSLGVFFHVSSGKKLNNSFYRQAELKSLAEAIATFQIQANTLASSRIQVTEKLKAFEKRRSEIFEVRRKKEMDLVKENFDLQRAIKDHEKLKSEMTTFKKEKETLKGLDAEEKEIVELKNRAACLKNDINNLLDNLKTQETLLEKWQEVNQYIQIIKTKQQHNAIHEKKMIEEIEDLQARVKSTLNIIVRQELELDHALNFLKMLKIEVKDKEKQITESKKDCESCEKELIQKRKSAANFEKEIHAYEINLAKDLSEKKNIEFDLLERHSLSVEAIKDQEILLHLNLEEATKEMHRLRHALENAGAVNLAAISEFQETQARFDYLDQQLKDLDESKKDLEEIIAKLDQESRKIFKKTFNHIRENFQKNFKILFNGGSADLTFTESSDILEAGIEIIAKPPGKQMRAISLLSGGEKCLTALALLFSIFEVKPAPFCILDEVDAPLDESNIERFTNVLKQFVDETQFIIVTHNKKTMAIADLLIGVSMEEKGVSKLISLSLEKKTSAALL